MIWYEKEVARFSPVISTRVRFARNLEKIPFPQRLDLAGKKKVFEKVKEALLGEDYTALSFALLSQREKEALLEQRLVSTAFLSSPEGTGLMISSDGETSLMVNEEDHIRLQVLSAGKCIDRTLEKALLVEEKLRQRLPIAYREGLGFLTSCPTNLGAGLRISVMIHLPALTALSAVSDLAKSLGHRGFTVRGVLGEGSRGSAGIYQISNQQSREKKPQEIAEALKQVLLQIEEAEQKAAQKWMEQDPDAIKDRIGRSIGILYYAEKMSYSEFVGHFANVRFGKALGLESARRVNLPDRLLFALSPANLVLKDGELVREDQRDVVRCRILKTQWNKE